MTRKAKPEREPRSNHEIRTILLRYFYDRNNNATSARGKRGSAVKISDARRELKLTHGLSQQEIQRNLTYLISEGWVEEVPVEKTFTAPGGTLIPSTTTFYQITSKGIDKIEGPGEFTMPKFHGVKIDATGQNIITVGDGNQVNARFGELAESLAQLRNSVTGSAAAEAEKLAVVADIETIQSQLAKPQPNRGIVRAAWEAVQGAAAVEGFAAFVARIAGLIAGFMS